MRYGLIGVILLAILVTMLLKSVYVGGLGGILVLVFIILLLTGKV